MGGRFEPEYAFLITSGKPVTGIVVGFFVGLIIGIITAFIEDPPDPLSWDKEIDSYSKVPLYFIQRWLVGLRHFFQGVFGCLSVILVIVLFFGIIALIIYLIGQGF